MAQAAGLIFRALSVSVAVAVLLVGCSKPVPPQTPPVTTEAAARAPAPYQPGESHRQALAQIGAEQYAEAEATLKALVGAEPRNADAWNDLSFVQAKQMRYPDSAKSAREALAIRPGFVYAQYNLGWALLQTADWRKAIEPLQAATAAQPDRPEPLYALGRWHEQAGDRGEALALYGKAAAMEYDPAIRAAAHLSESEQRRLAAEEEVARFPQAPPGVVRGVMNGFIPSGVTRRLVQVLPVRFADGEPPRWAALYFDKGTGYVGISVMVQTAEATGTGLNGFMGSCDVASLREEAEVKLELVPYAGGEHLLVRLPGESVLCGLQGRLVRRLYQTKSPVSLAREGLSVGGQLLRFVPETARYLPAAEADAALALVSEVRKAGYAVATTEAVVGLPGVKVTGKEEKLLAWVERTGNGERLLVVAVKPEGEPVILHIAGEGLTWYDPSRAGQISVPGHTFLAVSTHEKNGPNGGDVLVLEYDRAKRGFRQVFHVMSDFAGFSEKDVYTIFKQYLPEGGFDLYVTTYTWDEARGTFVPGKTEKAGKK